MKLLRVLRTLLPSVELRVNKHLSTDLRGWRIVHRARRARECRKVPASLPFLPEVPGMIRRQGE